MSGSRSALSLLLIEKAVYGGDGMARLPTGEVTFVPFVLPGERVELLPPQPDSRTTRFRLLEPSSDRVEPGCVHFGVCGGCQYQMAGYPAQLRMKEAILRETLERSGLLSLPEIQVSASTEPWGYRNRVRLRVREVEGTLLLGYNIRGTESFLPVRMCPIAAPVLWQAAEQLQSLGQTDPAARSWLAAATEVELLCDAGGQALQVHLLCPGPVPASARSFSALAEALGLRLQTANEALQLSAAASQWHAASGRAGKLLATAGKGGLPYRVEDETFWLKPGSFFQVNRFLLQELLSLVCNGREGVLAWDLFAGAGLFSRRLRRGFRRVTAVEANPLALEELRRGLRPAVDQALGETVLPFLRRAAVERDRPDLVVLDPPRAGAGEEACRLLATLRPAEIVYVSCDPTTLARDAAVLAGRGYHIEAIHLVDLFPQTYHLETVMVLRRVAGDT